MPRKLDPAKLAHAAELYVAGKSYKEAASIVGLNADSLSIALRRGGVETRPRTGRPAHNKLVIPDGVISMYEEGASELAVSKHFGISRPAIRRALMAAEVHIRSGSEANLLRAARLTPEQRQANAAAAHAAVRGSHRTQETVERVSAAREAAGAARGSRHEAALDVRLRRHFPDLTREKAIGRYNVDFAIGTVAVEVLGGNWHAYRASHAERTPYILNQGWTLVFIWAIRRAPIAAQGADYIVSLVEQARRDPSLSGQYRVIRGDGKVFASGSADDDEFTLVPPSVRGFDGWPLT